MERSESHYSPPPVTLCYRRCCYKMRSVLHFTRLLSGGTVRPSAAQFWAISFACSCHEAHVAISWPPSGNRRLGEAAEEFPGLSMIKTGGSVVVMLC